MSYAENVNITKCFLSRVFSTFLVNPEYSGIHSVKVVVDVALANNQSYGSNFDIK